MRWIAVAALVTLAGCGQAGEQAATEVTSADITADAAINAEVAERAPGVAPPAQTLTTAQTTTAATGAAPTTPVVTAPLLAYRHSYSMELPARAVRTLLDRHENACVAAGQTVCQIIAVESDTQGRDRASAKLELRARPDWLRRFRGGLEGEAKTAGGRVEDSGTSTEDLTRAIVDTEAQLRAKSTLRDRLIRLLAERPGKLQEILEVEREIARVQGEIDAGASTLAVMRTRVATSALTIEYRSGAAPVQDGVFTPLSNVSNSFVSNLVLVLAGILSLVSWLLPFALLLAGLAWLAPKLRRRFAPAKPPRTQVQPPETTGTSEL